MFIRCHGRVADEPYLMPFTETRIYSLEELCYYIGHNIYTITEEFFTEDLVRWLRNKADQPRLAKKLSTMITNNEALKDLVVTILCACDYYKEKEIREFIRILDEIVRLPIHEKKKIRADNFLRAGLYAQGAIAYQQLLHGSFATNFSTESYGNILHNQGIAHFYTASFAEAERDFKEAYTRNHKAQSLNHYLYLLLMQGKDAEFQKACRMSGMNVAQMEIVRKAYEAARAEAVVDDSYEDEIDIYKEELRKATYSAV